MATFNIPVRDGKRLEFDTLAELGKHYAMLGNAYRRKSDPESVAKAAVYDIISWQLQNSHDA